MNTASDIFYKTFKISNKRLCKRLSHLISSEAVVRSYSVKLSQKYTRESLCQSLRKETQKRLWHSCFPVNFEKF